jgi:mRNA-degrading endonuclease RelE of RelBE toxin-antitoxin system
MMIKVLLYKKQAEKYLKSVDENTFNKLKKALDLLCLGQGDIAKLNGKLGYYRLKIDHFRIIFNYENGKATIIVIEINTRTNIKYKRWQ